MSSQKRDEILTEFTQAVYQSSTAAVFFHTAIAEQIGLGATEEKTLFILKGMGALTAGEIAQQTGLTTGSVTSLIDRMESKGFVRRVRDTQDRRRVIVEVNEEKYNELMQIFASIQDVFVDLLAEYSDEQLATISDYLNKSAILSYQAIEKLRLDAVETIPKARD